MKFLKLKFALLAATAIIVFASCSKTPALDEQNRLMTTRADCYISFFDLLGSDNRTVLVSGNTIIDTTNLTVKALAKFGTNLSRVKPYCSMATDAILEPGMGQWIDFSQPRQYMVTSGNRQVHKTYTITITLQQ